MERQLTVERNGAAAHGGAEWSGSSRWSGMERQLTVERNGAAAHGGAEWSGSSRSLFSVLEMMGESYAARCHHVEFGRILGMSTRRGNVTFLSDVLEEAKEQMRLKQMESKNLRDLSEETSDTLGISAVLIADLRWPRRSNYNFKWEKALQTTGETGPVLQYLHARLCSLESVAKEIGVDIRDDLSDEHVKSLLSSELAMAAIHQIARLEEVLEETLAALDPAILVDYVFDLRSNLNQCFVHLPVKGSSRMNKLRVKGDWKTLAQRLPITALEVVSEFRVCLVGEGSFLSIYQLAACGTKPFLSFLIRHQVFPAQERIHGIYPSRSSDKDLLLVDVIGSRFYRRVELSQHFQSCRILCDYEATDWIWDVCYGSAMENTGNDAVFLAKANSEVEKLNITPVSGKIPFDRKIFQCEDRSILYSCRLIRTGDPLDSVLVLAGTLCREILLWWTISEVNPVICRLRGHEGAVFTVAFNELSSVIATGSDDRSVCFYQLEKSKLDPSSPSEPLLTLQPFCRRFGHISRVWRLKALPTDGGFVSLGEFATHSVMIYGVDRDPVSRSSPNLGRRKTMPIGSRGDCRDREASRGSSWSR
ncbi:unnamed protein product [Cyprideis torosa]|uniref:tRNA (34-2'-O)-methyltransferase regulator WDR6 n=1 Tax=Cyprideis torosa TaxID=163714 RepID=A0A7R8WBW5_9CRUS|nr:unnamed protein product [Cyprideis torosa]CAG0886792.1 unnamed protein product [Cyprideis torosa]